jgi:hypothetical protein
MNDPEFGLSVKSFPVNRSSYAVLSLFLVENFQMSTSELEFAENTLVVEDNQTFFKSQNTVTDPGFGLSVKIRPRMRSSYVILSLFRVENMKKSTSKPGLAEKHCFW